MSYVVVLPSYNERENILELIETIFRSSKDSYVVVVDDNSPDETFKVVDEFKNNLESNLFERLHLIKRQKKDGRGGAVWDGLKFSLTNIPDAQYFIEMDCDFSHNPSYISTGIKLLEKGHNLVLGSRYPSGKIINWPFSRRVISFFANLLARILIDRNVHDFTNGFRFYDKDLVTYLLDQDMKYTGYINLSETISLSLKAGKSIESFPIVFVNRKLGKSNTDFKELANSLVSIFKIAIDHRFK
jgi:dolichol-phosphate mannosyltransferase